MRYITRCNSSIRIVHSQRDARNTCFFLLFPSGIFFSFLLLFPRTIEYFHRNISSYNALPEYGIRSRKVVRYSFHNEDIRLTFAYNPIHISRSRLRQ